MEETLNLTLDPTTYVFHLSRPNILARLVEISVQPKGTTSRLELVDLVEEALVGCPRYPRTKQFLKELHNWARTSKRATAEAKAKALLKTIAWCSNVTEDQLQGMITDRIDINRLTKKERADIKFAEDQNKTECVDLWDELEK